MQFGGLFSEQHGKWMAMLGFGFEFIVVIGENLLEQVDMSGPPYLLRVQYIEILKPVSKSLSLFEARVNNFKVKSYNNPFRGSKMVLSQGDCIK